VGASRSGPLQGTILLWGVGGGDGVGGGRSGTKQNELVVDILICIYIYRRKVRQMTKKLSYRMLMGIFIKPSGPFPTEKLIHSEHAKENKFCN